MIVKYIDLWKGKVTTSKFNAECRYSCEDEDYSTVFNFNNQEIEYSFYLPILGIPTKSLYYTLTGSSNQPGILSYSANRPSNG